MDQALAWVTALAIGGLIRDIVGRFLNKGQADADVAQKAMATASAAMEQVSKMRVELDECHKLIRNLWDEIDQLTTIVSYYDNTTDI